MKNLPYGIRLFLIFILGSFLLFGGQKLLSEFKIRELNYKIHFLIFFCTFIGFLTMLIFFIIGKKNFIGFIFLGFVIFKLFAIAYIAIYQAGFKENLLFYFGIYWLYLLLEVVLISKMMKK